MRELRQSRLVANGVGLAVFEWPGESTAPAVLLAHATGFHARCWDQVVALLPGRRCVASDMRGHGRSDKPPPPYDWHLFGDDLAAIAREFGLRGAIGVGHSQGGHALTRAAARLPGAFSALLLIDPVIFPREHYNEPPAPQEHFAARRRNAWASADEMFARFRGRPPFDAWDPAVLRDYCDYGLLPAPSGEGFVLACPPEIEAATYAGNSGTDVHDDIAALEIPVRVLRAQQRSEAEPGDMRGSPTPPQLAVWFRHGTDVYLPEQSHLMPMENPALIARHILELG
ncbi:MAG: alpha/beta fold hydrolase [Tepidiformaceae bacterium]